MLRHAASALVLSVLAAPLGAQAAPATDPAYQRAATLVREGHGEEGRRIVDSLFVRARSGSPELAEALYWRAALATDAQQAERDYRKLIVDHPLSPRVERALLAMAQLEIARNDRERALVHLQRLTREHPESSLRAEAAFWTARVRFDQNDEPRACTSLDEATRSVAPDDAELRNQIEFFASRCVGVARASAGVPAAEPADAPGREPVAETSAVPARDTAPRAAAPRPQPPAPAAPQVQRDAAFTLQVAAYNTRAEADALVRRLKTRGTTARVVGAEKPFRVRVGSYATRSAALTAQRELKARNISTIVVQEPAAP